VNIEDFLHRHGIAAARHEHAAVMTVEDLTKYLGATSLGYLSIQGAVDAVGRDKGDFCLACFSGEYPIPVPIDLKKHAFDDPPEVGELAAIAGGQYVLPVN